MTKLIITGILLILLTITFTGFHSKPYIGVRLKQCTTTIISDTSAIIEALIDNGEREQTITISCSITDSFFKMQGIVKPNDRNVKITYTGQIKLTK